MGIPMWHRKGGLIVTAATNALRISDQDWSELVVEAYPSKLAGVSSRRLVTKDGNTQLTLRTDGRGNVQLQISAPTDGAERSWRVRLHLALGDSLDSGVANGHSLDGSSLVHIAPAKECNSTFPFDGPG